MIWLGRVSTIRHRLQSTNPELAASITFVIVPVEPAAFFSLSIIEYKFAELYTTLTSKVLQ